MRPAPPTPPPDPGPCRSLLRAPHWVWRLLWPPNSSSTPSASQWSSPVVEGFEVGGEALLPTPGLVQTPGVTHMGRGWAGPSNGPSGRWHYQPLARLAQAALKLRGCGGQILHAAGPPQRHGQRGWHMLEDGAPGGTGWLTTPFPPTVRPRASPVPILDRGPFQ